MQAFGARRPKHPSSGGKVCIPYSEITQASTVRFEWMPGKPEINCQNQMG